MYHGLSLTKHNSFCGVWYINDLKQNMSGATDKAANNSEHGEESNSIFVCFVQLMMPM